MAILNGKALTAARGKRGWTQRELSEATKPKVDVSTISRIERGKPTRVRKNTLRALAKALDMQPESLCAAAEAERDVMKLRIESAARNALTLVALRYRIRRESIIEAAPLLFLIAAEQSLKERQSRVAGVRASADALSELYRGIPHLPPNWPLDDDELSSEERSIEARDLFGSKVLDGAQHFRSEFYADFDEAEKNPFVEFLRNSLSKVSASNEAVESVRWSPGLWPRYEICAEEAGTIVGNDAKAARAILSGAAVLHEMPKGTPQQRAEWAQAEYNRKYGDSDDFFDDLVNASNADSQASNSGDAS